MNAMNRSKFGFGLVSFLALSATAVNPALSANGGPVCATARDVNSVMGNGPAVIPEAYCQVEQRVQAIAGSQDVSTVMGNGPRYFDRSPIVASTVATRSLRGSPVEMVMGRSGDAIPATVLRAVRAFANSAQE